MFLSHTSLSHSSFKELGTALGLPASRGWNSPRITTHLQTTQISFHGGNVCGIILNEPSPNSTLSRLIPQVFRNFPTCSLQFWAARILLLPILSSKQLSERCFRQRDWPTFTWRTSRQHGVLHLGLPDPDWTVQPLLLCINEKATCCSFQKSLD